MADYKKISLATLFSLIFVTVIYTKTLQPCYFSEDASYQRYQCVRTSANNLTLIECSLKCCSQQGCIGIFHDKYSSCMLINATEKNEECEDLNWNIWLAYKKKKDLGTCSSYLMNTFGFNSLGKCGVMFSNRSLLNYVPSDSNEVGGENVEDIPVQCLFLELPMQLKVRGVASQGRWRNESIDSCCDERVTGYKIHWSVDCTTEWIWNWADNAMIFEANTIPDAGNVVVEHLFEQPVFGKCFAFYPVNWHLTSTARWDIIGCET